MDDGHCRLTRRVHNLMDHIFDHEIRTQYVVGGKGSVYRLLEVIFVHVEADLGEEGGVRWTSAGRPDGGRGYGRL